MDKFLNLFSEFGIATVILRLCIAACLGGLIGSERGRHGRPAGLRTHILICIGAAMTSVTSMYLSECLGYTGDVARISAQVISGIGFLGAGTIMIRNSSIITGLTTAAGMWATATIGIALGYGFYSGAVTATFICIFSVTILSRLEKHRKKSINVYIELNNLSDTEQVVELICKIEKAIVTYDVITPKSGCQGNVGIVFVLHEDSYFPDIKNSLCEISSVVMILKEINI